MEFFNSKYRFYYFKSWNMNIDNSTSVVESKSPLQFQIMMQDKNLKAINKTWTRVFIFIEIIR